MEEYFKNEKIIKIEHNILIEFYKILYFLSMNKNYWNTTHNIEFLYKYKYYLKQQYIEFEQIANKVLKNKNNILNEILSIDLANDIIIYR